MDTKLRKAESATGRICDLVADARVALVGFDGRIVNGHGIFTEAGYRRDNIITAIARLQAALDIIRHTSWPSAVDYDAAEDGRAAS